MRATEAQHSALAAMAEAQQQLAARMEAFSAPLPARLLASMALSPASPSPSSSSTRNSPVQGGGEAALSPTAVGGGAALTVDAEEATGAAGPLPLWRTVAATLGKGQGADLALTPEERQAAVILAEDLPPGPQATYVASSRSPSRAPTPSSHRGGGRT